MESIEWKKQKHHILKGETIELVPVQKKIWVLSVLKKLIQNYGNMKNI